jgi:hypothetical protein
MGSLEDIDFSHIMTLLSQQWLLALVEYFPQLRHHVPAVNALFHTTYDSKTRCPITRKMSVQPLGTNSEHELETHGMHCALDDFASQMGLTAEDSIGFHSGFEVMA